MVVALAAALATGAVVSAVTAEDDDSSVTDLSVEVGASLGTTTGASGETLAADTSFELLEGGRTSFGEYRGTPMVLNFFAASCEPCIREMPALEEVADQLDGQVEVLGLNLREQVAEGRRIVAETGVTYDIGRDPSGSIFTELGGLNLPTTYFVNADGTVVASHMGELSADELRQLITEKLGVTG